MRHPDSFDADTLMRGRQRASADELMRRMVIANAIDTDGFKSQGDPATRAAGEWFDAMWSLDELRGQEANYMDWPQKILSGMWLLLLAVLVFLPAQYCAGALAGFLMGAMFYSWRKRLWCKHNAAAWARASETTHALDRFLSPEALATKP